MKRFAYAAIGILALTLAHEIGARGARADVDPGNPGPVLLGGQYAWSASGECWAATGGDGQWTRSPPRDLPIPAQDVAMVEEAGPYVIVVAQAGDVWRFENDWLEMQPFPAGPVSIEPRSWGSVKGDYR